jgi:predicted DNA-binding antitoxin AbrB/MazE fold protein
MQITVEATYENGVLKPAQPLPLKENERVQIRIDSVPNWSESTAGMLKWTGDFDDLRRVTEDDKFSILESP